MTGRLMIIISSILRSFLGFGRVAVITCFAPPADRPTPHPTRRQGGSYENQLCKILIDLHHIHRSLVRDGNVRVHAMSR
jgi:hypothetical protein